MKKGKFIFAILLIALGLQLRSQTLDPTEEAYIYMREYIHPLRLSQSQIDDWVRLSEVSNYEIREIINSQYLSPNTKSRKIFRELDRKDSMLRRILSRRQYQKFRFLKEQERRYGSSNYYDTYEEPVHVIPRPVYRNDNRGCF